VLGGRKDPSKVLPIKVLQESLVYWPPDAAKRVVVFERTEEGLKTASRRFHLLGFTKPLSKILRPNASLISTLAQLGHEPSIVLRNAAGTIHPNIMFEKFELSDEMLARHYATAGEQFAALNREISRLDLGIKEISLIQASPGIHTMNYVHRGHTAPLPSNLESNGTRQFVRLFPMLHAALAEGGIAVIDELDSSIHPLILPEILRWFYDSERNPHDAQIWFTCQNPYLLQELEKEEIFFCEKDDSGCTTVFGLSAIKAVRRMDNYTKKYLGGAYGAVPHIG
jgi:hypothetical protein